MSDLRTPVHLRFKEPSVIEEDPLAELDRLLAPVLEGGEEPSMEAGIFATILAVIAGVIIAIVGIVAIVIMKFRKVMGRSVSKIDSRASKLLETDYSDLPINVKYDKTIKIYSDPDGGNVSVKNLKQLEGLLGSTNKAYEDSVREAGKTMKDLTVECTLLGGHLTLVASGKVENVVADIRKDADDLVKNTTAVKGVKEFKGEIALDLDGKEAASVVGLMNKAGKISEARGKKGVKDIAKLSLTASKTEQALKKLSKEIEKHAKKDPKDQSPDMKKALAEAQKYSRLLSAAAGRNGVILTDVMKMKTSADNVHGAINGLGMRIAMTLRAARKALNKD